MASVSKSAHPAAKSRRGLSLKMALCVLLSCGGVAGSVWGVASSLSAMQEASRVVSRGPLQLQAALSASPRPQPVPKAVKSSRFLQPSEGEIKGRALSAQEIVSAHQRSMAPGLALAQKRETAENAKILTAFARAERPVEQARQIAGTPVVVTALVEDVPVRDVQPFDLVLAKTDAEEPISLPGTVPLPEARPLTRTGTDEPRRPPVEDKAALPKTSGSRSELAYAKPERPLFGGLFSRKSGEGAWRGNDTKVAIYDVSNATVYLPDGTKLRAHSGIGIMRDNPRYEHVKMNGPTPAGIYRLSMREKRFYGVEAIRMTSIDGRDPKNRTGLLTHTNLLRGRIGSHGCVAFQNYQPFLNAFKRGEVKTLVVVPELPSSSTQLAALYRKAGA